MGGISSALATPQTKNPSQDQSAAFLRVHGVTQPPHGFVAFCSRDPRHCLEGRYQTTDRPDFKTGLAELNKVNTQANAEIEPATDLEAYGVPEYWALPITRGDCEDYALLKRHRLIKAGWPASALLMTVVLDEANEGHAVLTVRTSDGDYVLDNKTNDIKLWNKTPYRFLMRQSYLNPQVWMSLDPSKAQPSVPVVGVAMPR
jgi:predicted transglutaminase-like cysteine proteinase